MKIHIIPEPNKITVTDKIVFELTRLCDLFSQKGCEEGTNIPKVIGYFEAVLEYIKGFGGDTLVENAERFLLQSGISKEAIAAIRQNVLE